MNRFETQEESERWLKLRSDIYIRDKGICWVCNEFVELRDYDLGHLIDKCNGGQDDYDNLAVMHRACNLSKPRHKALEEAMKWKLTPKYLILRPITYKKPQIPIEKGVINSIVKSISNKLNSNIKNKQRRTEDIKATEQLVLEYFNNRPELISKGECEERVEAIKQLGTTLGITSREIRRYLRHAGLIQPKYVIKYKDEQYTYIYNNLDKLLNDYSNAKGKTPFIKAKMIGLTSYGCKIMFYLSGQNNKIDNADKLHISRRVKALNIPIREPVN